MYSLDFTPLLRVSKAEVCRRPCLLKHLSQLASGLQQRKLPLLAGKFSIEERHPFVVFIETSLIDVSLRGAALGQFRLQNWQRFLGELKIEAGHFVSGVKLANIARFLQYIGADFLASVPQGEFGFAQLAFRQFYVGEGLGAENWNVDIDADSDVVALKVIEEFTVIVEFAKHLVQTDG